MPMGGARLQTQAHECTEEMHPNPTSPSPRLTDIPRTVHSSPEHSLSTLRVSRQVTTPNTSSPGHPRRDPERPPCTHVRTQQNTRLAGVLVRSPDWPAHTSPADLVSPASHTNGGKLCDTDAQISATAGEKLPGDSLLPLRPPGGSRDREL